MRTRKQLPAAPLGLRLAFANINDDTATGTCAPHRAAIAHAAGVRMLTDMDQMRNDHVMGEEISRTAKALFPGAEDLDPLRGEAGFCLGFAVCWLVLTAM